MTADIITLADRRPAVAPPRRDAAAGPATIFRLSPAAARGSALAVTEQASNAAASAAALDAACRDLLDKFATIDRHSDAIRGRMDALLIREGSNA